MNLKRARPRAPHAFNRYLSVTCDYVLEGKPINFETPMPLNLPDNVKKIWQEQEKERVQLRMEHQVERDRLRLCMEQAVLRVHGRASRTNQVSNIYHNRFNKQQSKYTFFCHFIQIGRNYKCLYNFKRPGNLHYKQVCYSCHYS